jgi:BirA family transcriptional regulator, biotin operon repressor / biotin---[acetyl-CoA-carboxylase] ligase
MEDILDILSPLPLAEIRYFDRIGSTNDEALTWASRGAADLSLVLANEQTHGRGRLDRNWFTPPDSALALSLILHPTQAEIAHPSQTTGLLALALVHALEALSLAPLIKWPNDVLVKRMKLAGILVESIWNGDRLDTIVLGMGVNVSSASIPPADQILYPATSIENELGRPVRRGELLFKILENVLVLRHKIGSTAFVRVWEDYLAFREEQVIVTTENGNSLSGTLLGLEVEGGLSLKLDNGKIVTVQFGDVHLRPVA